MQVLVTVLSKNWGRLTPGLTSHGRLTESPGWAVTDVGPLRSSGRKLSSVSWYLLIRIGMKLCNSQQLHTTGLSSDTSDVTTFIIKNKSIRNCASKIDIEGDVNSLIVLIFVT